MYLDHFLQINDCWNFLFEQTAFHHPPIKALTHLNHFLLLWPFPLLLAVCTAPAARGCLLAAAHGKLLCPYLTSSHVLLAGAELTDSMCIIAAVLTQPPAAAAFPALWGVVWPIMVKALEDQQLDHINQPALRALAAVVARFIGELTTKRPFRRMLPVDTAFVQQLTQLLLSTLRRHCRHPLIGMLMLVVTRFASLRGGPLMPRSERDNRQAFVTGLILLLTH